MRNAFLTTLAVGVALAATSPARAADPVSVPVALMAPEEAAEPGHEVTLEAMLGWDDGDWFTAWKLALQRELPRGFGLEISTFGAVAFAGPTEASLGFQINIHRAFGPATIGVFTGLSWAIPGGDRQFVLGAEFEVEAGPAELAFEIAQTWEFGVPDEFEIEATAAFALGAKTVLTPGFAVGWSGGPPELTLGLTIEHQLRPAFALMATVERAAGSSWMFGAGFALTLGGR